MMSSGVPRGCRMARWTCDTAPPPSPVWRFRSILGPPKKQPIARIKLFRGSTSPWDRGIALEIQADPNNVCQATEFPFLVPHLVNIYLAAIQ